MVTRIKNNSTIVFSTGWQKNLQKQYYFKKNPGLSISAARYLVSKKVNLVGIDSPSIDKGNDTKFSVHQIFSKNNVLILENLCNLEKISRDHFKLIVLPLKLKDATGSPVRAIAV
jgi:kynurenine formamidase